MVILLPDEKDGLRNLENNLSKIKINELLQKMDKFKVNVKLPKFKIEQSIDLNDVLIRVCIKVKAFNYCFVYYI